MPNIHLLKEIQKVKFSPLLSHLKQNIFSLFTHESVKFIIFIMP